MYHRPESRDSLIISFRDSTDSITIDNFCREGKYQVEELVFANGTVWDANTVKAMSLYGTDGTQTITAYAEGSEIHAAGGNDSQQGADILTDGIGNNMQSIASASLSVRVYMGRLALFHQLKLKILMIYGATINNVHELFHPHRKLSCKINILTIQYLS
ncbi:TPA: hypothetical protein PFE29_004579, partial [Kluyvera ascorbata]|nr:hypothetical protein [Kluyvera ascorbata]